MKAGSFVIGVIGGFVMMLLTLMIYGDNNTVHIEAIQRGYAVYCGPDLKWKWIDECKPEAKQ